MEGGISGDLSLRRAGNGSVMAGWGGGLMRRGTLKLVTRKAACQAWADAFQLAGGPGQLGKGASCGKLRWSHWWAQARQTTRLSFNSDAPLHHGTHAKHATCCFASLVVRSRSHSHFQSNPHLLA